MATPSNTEQDTNTNVHRHCLIRTYNASNWSIGMVCVFTIWNFRITLMYLFSNNIIAIQIVQFKLSSWTDDMGACVQYILYSTGRNSPFRASTTDCWPANRGEGPFNQFRSNVWSAHRVPSRCWLSWLKLPLQVLLLVTLVIRYLFEK